MRQLQCDYTMRVYCCIQCRGRIGIIYNGEWYIKRLFYLKSHEEIASQLFVCLKLFTGRLTLFGIQVMWSLIVLLGQLDHDCHNCTAFFKHLKYSFMK